jgi:glycosyltransferase involved in cell wall biosynthesis
MADVCIIAEGSYPYISGGVSSWLHALISNLPNYRFALVYLGGKRDPTRTRKYTLPANVVQFDEIYIHDVESLSARHREPLDDTAWQRLKDFHAALHASMSLDDADFSAWLGRSDLQGITNHELLYSQKGWELIEDLYTRSAPDKSFIDYFWTFRYTHLPLFTLLEARLPEAKVYHSISLGFGGFLGALAKLRTGRPLLLTEHGNYRRELEMEIGQAEWIYVEKQQDYRLNRRFDFFQQWWLNMFGYMKHLAYAQADRLIKISSVIVRRSDPDDYAYPEKQIIIPNGIDTRKFQQMQRVKRREDEFNVGLVGRVVPIKDIKTFIRAISVARTAIPNLHAYVLGPTDEDPDYFEECRQMLDLLSVGDAITFTGQVKVETYFPTLDVLVLTSLNEVQPLVILEGNCAGIPVVATNVGSCRELLTGASAEDAAIGPSGIITPADSPDETANALIRLWRNPELRQRMGAAGRERVMRSYRQETLYQAYHALYQRYGAISSER